MTNEFSLIDTILSMSQTFKIDQSSLLVKPGDDAALLKTLKRPIISTDTQRENIHFSNQWQSPEEVGYKAVVISLSDLAASYAKPVAIFINLAIPSTVGETYIKSLYQGIFRAIKQYNCSLGGGNISRSSEISLDLFSIGEALSDQYPHRSNALPGDGLYVTGPLGLARAGLESLQHQHNNYPLLIKAFKNPIARFDASIALMNNQVNCVMDLSDGLLGDAEHIAKAASLSIEFFIDEQTISPELKSYCTDINLSPLDMVLAGGEDYELLFSCTNEKYMHIKETLPEIYQVGKCLPFQGKHIINPPAHITSFNHFQD